MNDNNVSVQINSKISDGGTEPVETELFVKGRYSDNGENRIINYVESRPDGENIYTEIKVSDHIQIIRRSDISSELYFEKGKKLFGFYDTPAGKLSVGTDCKNIENELNKLGGKLTIEYTIDINGVYVGENEITIYVRPA